MNQTELERPLEVLNSINLLYLDNHPKSNVKDADKFINQHMVAQNSTGFPIWDNPYSAMLFAGGRKAITIEGTRKWRITDNSGHLLIGEITPFYENGNDDTSVIIGYGSRRFKYPISKITCTT